MGKYFKLTDEYIEVGLTKLFRIECTKTFKYAEKGEKGGFVEKEENLSGKAWVSGNAWVYGDAWVSGCARVYGDARVSGDAWEESPLQIHGTRHYFNICKRNTIRIGCLEMTIEEWEKNYEEVGNNEGYTDNEIKEYGLYIKLAKELSKL